MRNTGKKFILLLDIQERLKKEKIITLITKEYPYYIEDFLDNVAIEPIYNVEGINFNGFNKSVTERKIIGYNITKNINLKQ